VFYNWYYIAFLVGIIEHHNIFSDESIVFTTK